MSYLHVNPLFDLIDDDGPHTLLEPTTPAYSNLTIRRAFIVWMYCGQQNEFREVCNYYHHLEALENRLCADERARSRHFEMDMFSNQPPSSNYLRRNFPSLYSKLYVKPQEDVKEEPIVTENCVFNLAGFNEMSNHQGATADEIVKASQMIRQYCRSHYKSLKIFLLEFKEYAMKCDLNKTVGNVAFYLKRKMIEEELEIVKKNGNFKVFRGNSHFDHQKDSIDDSDTNKPEQNDIEDLAKKAEVKSEQVQPRTILKRPINQTTKSDNLRDIVSNFAETKITHDTPGIGLKEIPIDNMDVDSESLCVFGILAKSISLESLLQSEDEDCVKSKYDQGFSRSHIQRMSMATIRKI